MRVLSSFFGRNSIGRHLEVPSNREIIPCFMLCFMPFLTVLISSRLPGYPLFLPKIGEKGVRKMRNCPQDEKRENVRKVEKPR